MRTEETISITTSFTRTISNFLGILKVFRIFSIWCNIIEEVFYMDS